MTRNGMNVSILGNVLMSLWTMGSCLVRSSGSGACVVVTEGFSSLLSASLTKVGKYCFEKWTHVILMSMIPAVLWLGLFVMGLRWFGMYGADFFAGHHLVYSFDDVTICHLDRN